MTSARFQFFTRSPQAVEWRLISSNNRELARCPEPFLDLGACLAAVDLLRDGIDAVEAVVLQDASGGWRWRLGLYDQAVATSSRAYLRRVECAATLVQFCKVAGDALVVPQLRTFR